MAGSIFLKLPNFIPARSRATSYFWAVCACVATTLVALPLLSFIDPTNIAMFLLLPVIGVAAYLGSGPAMLAAFLSVALFDFLFVPPRLSWAVADVQYLITFAVMLVVALVIGQLAARLRERAQEAVWREAQTRALYEMARELSGSLAIEQVAATARNFFAAQVGVEATLHLPPFGDDQPHVKAVYAQGTAMQLAAQESGYAPALLLPLRTLMQIRGVLQITAATEDARLFGEAQRPLLETVASLVAIAIERIHYVEVAQEAGLRITSERLRAALLSAVSHDLRTPLTVLVGLADTLAQARPPLPPAQSGTAVALRKQALRLARMVGNLLDMARLQLGRTQLRKEWQPLEEVVGASLQALESTLQHRSVRIDLPPDLPLLEFDAVLLERVLCNLLENAAKYAPVGEIAIGARIRVDWAELAVCDEGSGVPPGREESIFALFERGTQDGAASGTGLGLAICRAIVEAHGGEIHAENRPEGGACFRFTLPLGEPPVVEEDADV